MDEFKARITSQSGLSDSDKQALFAEMGDRLDRMSNLLNGEQTAQSKRLDDILAARRKKKEDLQKKYVQVNQTVDAQ